MDKTCRYLLHKNVFRLASIYLFGSYDCCLLHGNRVGDRPVAVNELG